MGLCFSALNLYSRPPCSQCQCWCAQFAFLELQTKYRAHAASNEVKLTNLIFYSVYSSCLFPLFRGLPLPSASVLVLLSTMGCLPWAHASIPVGSAYLSITKSIDQSNLCLVEPHGHRVRLIHVRIRLSCLLVVPRVASTHETFVRLADGQTAHETEDREQHQQQKHGTCTVDTDRRHVKRMYPNNNIAFQ